ncbi:MAG: hypothetical protein V4760_13090 [Bdellovibrionota bacterium]
MRTIGEFEPLLSQIMLAIAKDTRFRCRPKLSQILEENPRLVIAISHGSPLSWLPAVALLCAHFTARGGRDRRPMGVMDRLFFSLPGVKHLAAHLTQSEKALGFMEILESFMRGDGTDLVVFPEGSNCFFGDPNVLQPFRSPRFVELAIEADIPILVCAHRGSEGWGKAIEVDSDWLKSLDYLPKIVFDFIEARLKKTGLFTLPLWPTPMNRFDMICELVPVALKSSDLSSDPAVRREQITKESERIRAKMQGLLDELDSDDTRAALA